MVYLLIGAFALIAVLGGFKNMFRAAGVSGVFFAFVMAAVMMLNLIPAVYIETGVGISMGGAFLILCAVIAAFYKNGAGRSLYTVYMSLMLGLIFYAMWVWLYGVEIAPPEKSNIPVYVLCLLLIILFVPFPSGAFAASVIAPNFAAFLFYVNKQTPYIIGGGDTFVISSVLLVFSLILSFYVQRSVSKIYPEAKEMMFEASEEIAPDYDEKKR